MNCKQAGLDQIYYNIIAILIIFFNFVMKEVFGFLQMSQTAILADFLCKMTDKSGRPESMLKMYSAAISCLYEGASFRNTIQRLITRLIKSGTKRPAKRTDVMPVTPFVKFFFYNIGGT